MAQETTARAVKSMEELTPDQMRSIIKAYYAAQGVQVTRIDFIVGTVPAGTFEDYGTPNYQLRGARVTEESTAPGIKLPDTHGQEGSEF
jgi:hypothetical protein